jgi:methionyl-tRNA synthetase
VIFICGSDEHGAAITMRAKKEGTTPQEIVDKYNIIMRDAFQKFGISFDVYHRTSDALHHETSQQFFLDLYKKGEFQVESSEQYYDEENQQFLADRYITGTCPKCAHDSAYGDQCENCGSTLSPSELINPKSVLSGTPPVWRETKHWYLPLNKYQSWLEEWILKGKEGIWKTNVFGQCKSWLQAGLQARAMTRDLDWGVDVPLEEAKGKKLYVWLDAPIGYISATKQLFKELETGEQKFATPHKANIQSENWQKYWQDKDTKLVHFIGKDNIVFHCIIFPSILRAQGDYILPDNVPGNEFLNLEGKKISTSRNWAVWLHEYLNDFPDKSDVLRYVLCSILPETKDSEFTWADFKQRNDSELNAIFSNFVHRVLVLTQKYYKGVVPDALGDTDETLKATFHQIYESVDKIHENIENYRFRDALFEFMSIARAGNKYLADTEPWKLFKTNPEETKKVLFAALQIVGKLAILCRVFLPETAEKMAKMLNLSEEDVDWEKLKPTAVVLAPHHQIGEATPLFTNIEEALITAQVQKLHQTMEISNIENAENVAPEVAANPLKPLKEAITFEDFAKLDLRVGKILEAMKVPKADKLLQFKVEIGLETRTIISGVAEHFTPENMLGKQVLVLVNLAPRKIRGVESQGMILYAEDTNGKLHLVNPNVEGVNEGANVN